MNRKYLYYKDIHGEVRPTDPKYKSIGSPDELYDLLAEIWCEYTCAPRMRDRWTKENRTLGQCSVTAFLAQDIFGGRVYGILLPEGGYHCFNVVNDSVFDLTSEQFDRKLYYSLKSPEQLREVHFAKEEKRLRYEYLKKELESLILC